MNFIRTIGRDGKPIRQNKPKTERAQTRPKSERIQTRLTGRQQKAINDLLASMEKEGLGTGERLVKLRDTIDRQKITGELREKMLTGAVKDTYLRGDPAFTARHAAGALAILNGTDRAQAAELVNSWGQDAGGEDGEGE